uniref:Uncharacterized protein n=1 Tax=Moniliophthora roreri TaxID=221103 RepID=A0A0W0F6H1_MONRR
MAFLQGSPATISGGRFTSVQGSQHNTHIHGDLLQVIHQQDRELTVWDDYQCIRTGDINVMRAIGITNVSRWYDSRWRTVVARRIINLAQIGDSEKKFLHVTYDGPDAFKAFRLDFEKFSSVRRSDFIQLFGYNSRRGLPALIFHNELIPLSHVIVVNDQISPVLWMYFKYQFSILQIADADLDISELWIDAGTGTLQRGPYLEASTKWYWLLGNFPLVPALEGNFTPVSIQTYNESSTVFQYLITKVSTSLILRGISRSPTAVLEGPLTNKEVIYIITSLSGTVYNWHLGEVIVRWVDARERWWYELSQVWELPDAVAESRVIMEDGSVRFTVLPMDIQDLSEIQLGYVVHSSEEQDVLTSSWLAQAHSIFNQLGIHEDEWEDYCMYNCLWLHLQCHKEDSNTTTLLSPAYLFIRPFPGPSDCETVLQSWVESSKYFWSFDASGKEEISMETQVSLGLPSFTPGYLCLHELWKPSTYEVVRELHHCHGYDPRTRDLAHALGYPVLEIVEDGKRFQDLENSEVSSSSDILEYSDDSNGNEPPYYVS